MGSTVLLEAIFGEEEESEAWLLTLRELLPWHTILLWQWKEDTKFDQPLSPDLLNVQYAIVWCTPAKELAKLPNLRAVLLQGAGADQLASTDALPSHIPIVRLIDDQVASDMAAYALHWVLHFHFRFDFYLGNQPSRKWQLCPPYQPRSNFTVGVLGLGNVGKRVCDLMLSVGYRVLACSRTKSHYDGVTVFSAENLDSMLSQTNALINVLPLTDSTRDCLDAARLQLLPHGAILINIGRGATLVDDALCQALDSGGVKAAVLDVFREEPLPQNSPFWAHKNVTVTPHTAGRVFARSSVKYVVENINRIELGEKPFPILDRRQQY